MDKCPTKVQYATDKRDERGMPIADERPCDAPVYHDAGRMGGAGAYVCTKNSGHVHPGPAESPASPRTVRA